MADQRTSKTTATDLLRQQYLQVQQMFSELAAGRGDQRAQVFDRLRAQLAVHETAEEMIIYPELRALGPNGEEHAEARLEEEGRAKSELADLEKLGVDAPEFDER